MILVTGATGHVGREVVAALHARGAPVRALVRPGRQHSLPDAVEVVAGDLGEPGSLRPAFADVGAVFLQPGYPGLAELARAAGVRRIVQLSGGSAGSADLSNAITRYLAGAEGEVRASGLEWTMIRPSAFMSNALRWLPQLQRGDTVQAPFADVAVACVDPADIGAVAAVTLVEDGHQGHLYRPTGPVALRPAEQVAILAEVLGRPLNCVGQSNAEAHAAMLRTTPPEYVGAFFDFYVNGSLDESPVLPTVWDVTGKEPRTFRDWALAHAAEFS